MHVQRKPRGRLQQQAAVQHGCREHQIAEQAIGHINHVNTAFDFIGIPAGHTIFSAVYLAVVGSALLRGKRAALLWVLWVFEALWLLAQVAGIAFTSVRLANPTDAELLRDFGPASVQ